MSRFSRIWATEMDHLFAQRPDHPVLYFSPSILAATHRRFQKGFGGEVTYAVKANDHAGVLGTLAQGGMEAFDVASPNEMAAVRAVAPEARLHYHNPVRARGEIAQAVAFGVTSWSVDGLGEFAKLREQVPTGAEIAVRLALPVEGAAYHFGEKFGEDPDGVAKILRVVQKAGYRPSITFHPGTQCADPAAWVRYIETSAEVARRAQITLARLNVGGGFPSDREGRGLVPLEPIFDAIRRGAKKAFNGAPPPLVCEPGRAMVADAFTVAVQVKAVRACGSLFLNDGIYGLLAEFSVMGLHRRVRVMGPSGLRRGATVPRVLYGPTCDSLDRLPGALDLPGDVAEGDYILFDGLGAYTSATNTRFNGYGSHEVVTVGRAG